MISFVIYGEPASKANSRRIVSIQGKPRIIKSKKALDYEKMFAEQCPVLDNLIEDDVEVSMTIFYKTRRPDLDESVILDMMQGRIYKNDRQVKSKLIRWGLDRETPRAMISIYPMGSERWWEKLP